MSKSMAEIYKENKDEDGFLYITYASQEMFGLRTDGTTSPVQLTWPVSAKP